MDWLFRPDIALLIILGEYEIRCCLFGVQACKDYHVCKWPDELKNGDTSLAMYFDSLNDENIGVVDDILKKCTHIISFSHFLPR